jgi:hypothetical protein
MAFSCDDFSMLAPNSKHNLISQKWDKMLNITTQNKKFIFVFPFETMATIMASCFYFIHMNVKTSILKIHVILSFNPGHLKEKLYCVKKRQIYKGQYIK